MEDLRGPLILTVTEFVSRENGTAAFAVRAENTGDRALVNVLVQATAVDRLDQGFEGRVVDMPFWDDMTGQLVYDPQGLLESGSSWVQPLRAEYEVAPAGTEEDPYVFQWWVRYADIDGGRWEWRHWTCQRADGEPSTAKGCNEWFEYFPD